MADPPHDAVPEHPETGGKERRAAPRASALREGRLMTVQGLGPIVLIVDLSVTGALVRMRTSLTLPQDVVLLDRLTMMAHRATVVRRQELDLGLRFIRSQSLSGQTPPALAAAKAWVTAG